MSNQDQGRSYKQWTGGRGRFKSAPFLYRKYERGIKLANVKLHRVNNIERNIKRYVHIRVEIISLIPP